MLTTTKQQQGMKKVQFNAHVTAWDGTPEGPALIDTSRIIDISVQKLTDNSFATIIELEGDWCVCLRWEFELVCMLCGWHADEIPPTPSNAWDGVMR